jgi:hypothetical protein
MYLLNVYMHSAFIGKVAKYQLQDWLELDCVVRSAGPTAGCSVRVASSSQPRIVALTEEDLSNLSLEAAELWQVRKLRL